jgi:hypothetical protein
MCQADALDPTRIGVGDPHRLGHMIRPGAELVGDRCLICDRLLKARRRKLTKSQRAIEAALCWRFVGGPPNPHGGRPRKSQRGYPVSRGLMAAAGTSPRR